MVLELKNISKYYGDRKILEIDDLKIYENEKIGIVGQNGSGKTTLLNMIVGRVKPDIGEIIHKQNIIYMEQFEETNHENKNLSGGERVKVSIAKILVSNNNLLILDEPTNFLDIESIESLENLLNEYNGTILFVTHDKTLIDNIATDILVIKNHKIIEYEGNYSSYLQYEQERSKKQQSKNENDKLLLDFKLSQITSELAITKDEKRKKELEEEFNELIKLKHLTK